MTFVDRTKTFRQPEETGSLPFFGVVILQGSGVESLDEESIVMEMDAIPKIPIARLDLPSRSFVAPWSSTSIKPKRPIVAAVRMKMIKKILMTAVTEEFI